jgi:hypothetical protein
MRAPELLESAVQSGRRLTRRSLSHGFRHELLDDFLVGRARENGAYRHG